MCIYILLLDCVVSLPSMSFAKRWFENLCTFTSVRKPLLSNKTNTCSVHDVYTKLPLNNLTTRLDDLLFEIRTCIYPVVFGVVARVNSRKGRTEHAFRASHTEEPCGFWDLTAE